MFVKLAYEIIICFPFTNKLCELLIVYLIDSFVFI